MVPGTATHQMTLHRAPSGALVFGAGTVQFAWSVDSNHDNPFNFSSSHSPILTCRRDSKPIR